jgi:hypothetical protein
MIVFDIFQKYIYLYVIAVSEVADFIVIINILLTNIYIF